jgi:predicted HTH domain antitoxin
MTLTIPDEILRSARMTEQEVIQALAIALFQKDKLSLGQAARLAGMSQWDFRGVLAEQEIPLHYDVPELEKDIETLRVYALGK